MTTLQLSAYSEGREDGVKNTIDTLRGALMMLNYEAEERMEYCCDGFLSALTKFKLMLDDMENYESNPNNK